MKRFEDLGADLEAAEVKCSLANRVPYEEAVALLKEANETFEKVGRLLRSAFCLRQLATRHQHAQANDKAVELYDQVIPIFQHSPPLP